MIRPSTRIWRVVTIVCGLSLAVVSLLPSGKGRMGEWDKDISPSLQNALHVPAYTVLVALACVAWPSAQGKGYGRIFLIAFICCLYGTFLELAQLWVPGRSASLSDALLNVLGVLAGVVLAVGWWSLAGSRATQPPEVTGRGTKESTPARGR